jgi:hypothetical protein
VEVDELAERVEARSTGGGNGRRGSATIVGRRSVTIRDESSGDATDDIPQT